jgi:hypothetical protein
MRTKDLLFVILPSDSLRGGKERCSMSIVVVMELLKSCESSLKKRQVRSRGKSEAHSPCGITFSHEHEAANQLKCPIDRFDDLLL